jgi:transposase
MIRYVLTDAHWAQIELLCLGKKSDPGRTGQDGRLFLEAVLWIARTGSPWCDLLEELGNWNTVFQRFRYWAERDVFKRIFDVLSDDPDLEYAMVDATIVHVHRHAHGAKGGLIIRPSESPKASGRPRSLPSPMPSEILSASSFCPATGLTPWVSHR